MVDLIGRVDLVRGDGGGSSITIVEGEDSETGGVEELSEEVGVS